LAREDRREQLLPEPDCLYAQRDAGCHQLGGWHDQMLVSICVCT
jgi:hypothetical protein